MLFSQDDRNLFLYPLNFRLRKKMSQNLVTPLMTPPQESGFFYLYIIDIIEIILNN